MSQNYHDDETINIKVAIIGSCGVGKSSIINRFIRNEFNEEITSTVGANYSKKELKIDNKNVILDIWDTAGQEKFHSMGRHFYKNSHIIIIIYDMTNKNTFEDIKNHWFNDILEHADKYKVIGLVGNKFDLYDTEGVEEINENIIKEFIDQVKGQQDAELIHMKVSAKTGVNIKSLFQTLTKKYLEKELVNDNLEKAYSFKIKKDKKKEKEKEKEKKNCCAG
jgi:small GTP-binding protein